MKRACKLLSSLSKEEFGAFFNSIDTVLTDCDGVIWMENEVLHSANTTLNRIQELGKKVFYVTNNSTKTRDEYVVKCKELNFIADKDSIVSTSSLAAAYLKSLNFNKKVYIVGSEGISKELDLVGIKHTGVGPDPIGESVASYVKTMKMDSDVGAVVVGFDPHISYPKMMKAATYLHDPNCLFVATNTDENFPVSSALIVPGTGSIVRSIETCSGRPPFVVGKPADYIKQAIAERHTLDPARTLMIGDRCNTDILLGTRCGFKTLLVYTGVTTEEEVKAWKASDKPEDQALVPDFYLPRFGDLLPLLP